MEPVLTVTMNPTVDVSTSIAELVEQKKLRCSEPRFDPGGGGINVSRMIKELGGVSTAFVMAGGTTGGRLRRLVEAVALDACFLDADGDTRESLTVIERASGRHFRFILPGDRQPAAKADEALRLLGDLLARRRFGYLVASGSLAPGLPEDFFARLARLAQDQGVRPVLDTSGAPLGAAPDCGVYLVRTNRDEARELAGQADDDAGALASVLLERKAAEVVIIALGAEGTLVASAEETVRIRSPRVEVVSAVGAGDCFVGALTFALAGGRPLLEAGRLGVAAAAAAVTTPATELAHRAAVEALYEQAVVER